MAQPRQCFEPCGYDDTTAEHADIAQVMLPAVLSAKSEKCLDAIYSAHDGAVVFGYNCNFQWRWEIPGILKKTKSPTNERTLLSQTSDTENASSNTPSIGSESDFPDQSSSIVHSTSTENTIDSAVVANEPVTPTPLVRSFTSGNWTLSCLKITR